MREIDKGLELGTHKMSFTWLFDDSFPLILNEMVDLNLIHAEDQWAEENSAKSKEKWRGSFSIDGHRR